MRDRVTEIQDVMSRRRWRSNYQSFDVRTLQQEWGDGTGPLKAEYVPIRLVTILEVFVRSTLADLIDAGGDYAVRAEGVVKRSGLKIDFRTAQAIVGEKLSLGDLISHVIPVNGIEDIHDSMSELLGAKLFEDIRNQEDRWEVHIHGRERGPMITDVEDLRRKLARTFEVRHILVHELPLRQVFETSELGGLIEAVRQFCEAVRWRTEFLLHGLVPLTQTDMNIAAGQSAAVADNELQQVIVQARSDTDMRPEFDAAQDAWEHYRDQHSEYVSRHSRGDGGTISSLLYSSSFEQITRDRVKQLRNHLSRNDGA